MVQRFLLTILCLTIMSFSGFCQENEKIILIETNVGNLKAKLYNDTPLHRDNFIKLARQGHYDGSLFYRVIKNFVVQGGSLDSKRAVPGSVIGYGKSITIDAEILPDNYHKKGALAAPRQPDRVNVFKESDISQFYIVHGKKYTPQELDALEKSVNNPIKKAIQQKIYTKDKKAILDTLRAQKRVAEFREIAEKIKADIEIEWNLNTDKMYITDQKREDYINLGGVHHLDKEYTVFGELIEGFDVLDKIANQKTDEHDRPHTDIKIISVKVLN